MLVRDLKEKNYYHGLDKLWFVRSIKLSRPGEVIIEWSEWLGGCWKNHPSSFGSRLTAEISVVSITVREMVAIDTNIEPHPEDREMIDPVGEDLKIVETSAKRKPIKENATSETCVRCYGPTKEVALLFTTTRYCPACE